MRIFLDFLPEQTAVHRSRLLYAFRLFCAIYGHRPVLNADQAEIADVRIKYSSGFEKSNSSKILRLSNLYLPRSPRTPAPPPAPFERNGQRTALFYAPKDGAQPDWLGEIFEWVSCADEYSVRLRDSIGCIPYTASYVGRHKLDPRLPYAAIAMRLLQLTLCQVVPGCSIHPALPVPSVRHFVICTHDVDFLPVSYLNSLRRLAKNVIVSLVVHKSLRLAFQQAGKVLSMMAGGADPFDQAPDLALSQVECDYSASYYFLARRRHRRDGNYQIADPTVVDLMGFLERQGMEIGVHGSYTSLDEPEGITYEFARLRELGFQPKGGRQHWLRFTLDTLIPALERARVVYDSSLGWNESTGFRGGASFAFPLYDFAHERACTFLEIPLVVMDQSLVDSRIPEQNWFDHVAELLSVSRNYGWGGISILWHPNAMGGAQLPSSAGKLFHALTDHREEWKDTWTSAADFIRLVRQRYVDVGLLPADSTE